MSEDWLENIREIYQASDTAWADDIRTLVKEIERLQKDNKYLREARDRLMGDNIKSDATIATLQSDNLLLAKKVSGLRKLNIAYRLGDQKLADAALTELEALATPAKEK